MDLLLSERIQLCVQFQVIDLHRFCELWFESNISVVYVVHFTFCLPYLVLSLCYNHICSHRFPLLFPAADQLLILK